MPVYLILLSAVILAGFAVIIILLLRHSAAASSASAAGQAEEAQRRYEESTRTLLDETRRQYERQIQMLEQRLESQRAEMEARMERRAVEMRRQMAMEFSALASESLQRETESLQHGNRADISSILAPLRERLAEFQQTVSDTYVRENASREALTARIDTLARTNARIGEEARRLSNALKGDTRLQGRWGETVLQQLLERAGLVQGIHFESQAVRIGGKAIRSDEGRELRPDMVLLLPGEHRVVVDAKTSLTDYLAYAEADDEAQAEECLRRHVASVRKHIRELADKQYHRLIPGALEHTLMFMPNDASFLAAMKGDASLCDFALRNNVVIVSPAHLLSVVQLISQLWRVENQNRNAEAIAEAGGKLYDKVAAFLEDFSKIHRHIQAASRAYEGSLKQLTVGSQCVAARAERLREMGAKVTRRVPESMRPMQEPTLFDAAESEGLSCEARGEEKESEADAEMPVAVRAAEVVAVKREGGKGEVVDGRHFPYEGRMTQP